MKCNLKIALPIYKILYSIAFMFVMALIRPTVTASEVLTVIEPNICFLAVVFIADIYYCEFRENRINVFYLYPDKIKYKCVVERFVIDYVYLIILDIIFYWIYILFQHNSLISQEVLLAFGHNVTSCLMTILFFATLSLTMVNLFQNMWAGIGITLAVWFVFNTAIKDYLPDIINIFAYKIDPGLHARIIPSLYNRILYMILGVGLLLVNYLLVLRSPMKSVKGVKK